MQCDGEQCVVRGEAAPDGGERVPFPQGPHLAAGGSGRSEQWVGQQPGLREADAHLGHGPAHIRVMDQLAHAGGLVEGAEHGALQEQGPFRASDGLCTVRVVRGRRVQRDSDGREGRQGRQTVRVTGFRRPGGPHGARRARFEDAPQIQGDDGDGDRGARAVAEQCDLVRRPLSAGAVGVAGAVGAVVHGSP